MDMENDTHDCGFIIVENPNAGKKTWFQILYPLWFKIKNFPSSLRLHYKRAVKNAKNTYSNVIITNK